MVADSEKSSEHRNRRGVWAPARPEDGGVAGENCCLIATSGPSDFLLCRSHEASCATKVSCVRYRFHRSSLVLDLMVPRHRFFKTFAYLVSISEMPPRLPHSPWQTRCTSQLRYIPASWDVEDRPSPHSSAEHCGPQPVLGTLLSSTSPLKMFSKHPIATLAILRGN